MMEITVCFDKFLSFVRTQAIALLGPHVSKCGEYAFQSDEAELAGAEWSHYTSEWPNKKKQVIFISRI